METPSFARAVGLAALLLFCAAPAGAQAFVDAASRVPQGAPFNDSYTENVDFADVDGDGDLDLVMADGGDCCSDQNRLWINLGGAQGGTQGFFRDETSTRLPAVLDDSRDVDFADVDGDGDFDIHVSNTSAISNQANRIWINLGGAQGGSAGFFEDQTQARWLGIASGSSSVAPSMVLGGGGFVDWSCDSSFADLDADGDLDLVHSSYGGLSGGGVPTRLFLNDGGGSFTEFNPSGYRLTGSDIPDGVPALWAEGQQLQGSQNATGATADIADTPLNVDIGDLDGDFDLDLLHGARDETPRIFRNPLEENGGSLTAFREVTFAAMIQTALGGFNYEQELGDLDDDGDLDVYGVNWFGYEDTISWNDGAGQYGYFTSVPDSFPPDNQAVFLDIDGDGHMDVFVAGFVNSPDRTLLNTGPPSFGLVPLAGLPPQTTASLGADAGDVDGDGDTDLFVASDLGGRNVLLENVTQTPDATAPRVALEQVPERRAGTAPTRVRARALDNAPWTMTAFQRTVLRYTVDGGPPLEVPMRHSGGWMFHGELPGNVVGLVRYEVESTDAAGNAGVSVQRVYRATGCSSQAAPFCTAKAGLACGAPTLVAHGVASATAPEGFTLVAAPARGARAGVLLYNTARAPAPLPFEGGTLCVAAQGLRRGGPTNSLGTPGACDGAFALDLNTFARGLWTVPPTGALPATQPAPFLSIPGTVVHAQLWGRDTPATGSFLSAGLTWFTCP